MSQKARHTFTLIELLVVITVIAILAAMLLPALSRAKRMAREVVCVNNLKEVGLGVMVYSVDNDLYYPDRSMSQVDAGVTDGHIQAYRGRYYVKADRPQAMKMKTSGTNPLAYNIFKTLWPYHGADWESGASVMGELYTCPFSRDELVASSDNYWQRDYPIFPYKNRNWFGWIAGYPFYFSTMWKSTLSGAPGTLAVPMRKVGDRWQNGTGSGLNGTGLKYCNVIAADRMGNGQFDVPNANHPTLYGENTWTVKGGGPGWLYSKYLRSSASYGLDDGSVTLKRGISIYHDEMGGLNGRLIPVELFSDERR